MKNMFKYLREVITEFSSNKTYLHVAGVGFYV